MAELYVIKKDGVAIDVQTSTAGIVGLNEFIDGKLGDAGAGTVSSVNGHVGEVILTASAEKDGLMSKTDKAKLDALPVFTFEKVGEA